MLIPSIDLMGGRVVQLRQGAELMFEDADIEFWRDRFAAFPMIQVIDLDAALGRGSNAAIVRRLCASRPCQVGGGIRTADAARRMIDAGAAKVIIGSALFNDDGIDERHAREFPSAVAAHQLIAAIDGRDGRVVTRGWTHTCAITPAAAARALEPFVGGFLYTHVDTEGTMQGLSLEPVIAVKAATSRRLIAAGGIRQRHEIDTLDRLGIDAVVGMAIYTQVISID